MVAYLKLASSRLGPCIHSATSGYVNVVFVLTQLLSPLITVQLQRNEFFFFCSIVRLSSSDIGERLSQIRVNLVIFRHLDESSANVVLVTHHSHFLMNRDTGTRGQVIIFVLPRGGQMSRFITNDHDSN